MIITKFLIARLKSGDRPTAGQTDGHSTFGCTHSFPSSPTSRHGLFVADAFVAEPVVDLSDCNAALARQLLLRLFAGVRVG